LGEIANFGSFSQFLPKNIFNSENAIFDVVFFSHFGKKNLRSGGQD